MLDDGFAGPPDTPWRLAWRRFAAHRTTVHALGLLAVMLLAGLVEPVMNARYQGDPVLRALGAAPESLAFALLAGGTGAAAGLAWGAAAALLGGRAGRLLTAPARGMAALPLMLLPLLAGGLWGRDAGLLALSIGAAVAPGVAVAVQRAAQETARREFLAAAEAAGLSPGRVLIRHRLPALAAPFLLAAWPALPQALTAESFASLLGLGMPPGPATWGMLLAGSAAGPLLPDLVAPALVLAVTLLALNAVGDGLRRALAEPGP
ncbi:ABC transporter permease subunit [Azospirillum sp. ST 5-10]|uniref:ABC transporter permease subunit n=1 Tax=unclassified Azospirillum TaxID=2630922 RepID=UPI003F49C496